MKINLFIDKLILAATMFERTLYKVATVSLTPTMGIPENPQIHLPPL